MDSLNQFGNDPDYCGLFFVPENVFNRFGLTLYCELLCRLRLPKDDGMPDHENIETPGDIFKAIGRDENLRQWLNEQALEAAIEFLKKNKSSVGINVESSFLKPAFIDKIVDALAEIDFYEGQLIVEITEHDAYHMQNKNQFRNIVSNLRAADCLIAMDDYGSGCHNRVAVDYDEEFLKLFDIVKIDGALIKFIFSEPENETTDQKEARLEEKESLRKFCERLSDLGIKVVAEHVGQWEDLNELSDWPVEYCQSRSLIDRTKNPRDYDLNADAVKSIVSTGPQAGIASFCIQ